MMSWFRPKEMVVNALKEAKFYHFCTPLSAVWTSAHFMGADKIQHRSQCWGGEQEVGSKILLPSMISGIAVYQLISVSKHEFCLVDPILLYILCCHLHRAATLTHGSSWTRWERPGCWSACRRWGQQNPSIPGLGMECLAGTAGKLTVSKTLANSSLRDGTRAWICASREESKGTPQ